MHGSTRKAIPFLIPDMDAAASSAPTPTRRASDCPSECAGTRSTCSHGCGGRSDLRSPEAVLEPNFYRRLAGGGRIRTLHPLFHSQTFYRQPKFLNAPPPLVS